MSGDVWSRYTCSRLRTVSSRSSSRWLSGSPSTSHTPSVLGGLCSTWYVWPFGQMRRPDSRRTMSSSGTSMSSAAVSRRFTFLSAASSASACWSWRGKPSRRKPSSVSDSASRSRITPMMTSSGTRSPRSMYSFACLPRSVCSLTALRSMSPVATYASGKSSWRRSAWVPLPAPGGPSRMRLSSDIGEGIETTRARRGPRRGRGRAPYLLQEALVVAHHQLRLELLHRVEGDAHDDEQRGAAEEEVRARLIDEDRRERRDRREVQRAGEREAREDAVEELRRRPPRAHAGDEAAVLLEVVGLVHRVERDRRVEVREQDDEERLADDVRRIRRVEECRQVLRPR